MIFVIMLLVTVIAIRPLDKGSLRNSNVRSEMFTVGELAINQAYSEEIDGGEECEKNEGEEECLNRRSLAAHTDYIYTQNHNHP